MIAAEFRGIQDSICSQLEALDGKARFIEDAWTRAEGGGGRTRVIAGGALLEKGGVNFSEVHGPLTPAAAKALNVDGDRFYATGVSIVLHAHNPWVPTIHMNIRYFEAADQKWSGGGIDLTPVYVDPPSARRFHQRLKDVCDRWDPRYYADYKRWADDYFFLPHRDETRGIGGIFYDRLVPTAERPLEHLFGFSCDVGRAFAPLYAEMAGPMRDRSFTQRERDWQLLRRGRYVEFNLVHDRGTRFGLETGGRTESILMSLPAEARWVYDHRPEPGSPEAETLSWLRKGVEWVVE
ncbi:MAG: oxygen-dependent coproporphyrinogen oxidase [Flavobacteriales bacterium]|nr:oxygen-dependent coproporphyrinogen oxidase [Flavobacteriales bacterium]